MIKSLLWMLLLMLVSISCDPEYKDCGGWDTSEEGLNSFQSLLVDATLDGTVVRVKETEEGYDLENANMVGAFEDFSINTMANPFFATLEFEIYSAVTVGVHKRALVTCPALGLPSPEYDWFCEMNHPAGHAIAVDTATPTLDSFAVYDESPSVQWPPGSMNTVNVYFSQKPEHYPNHSALPYPAMRIEVGNWGSGWPEARENRCNSPVWEDWCNQE